MEKVAAVVEAVAAKGSVVEEMLREWASRAPAVGHAAETELFEPPDESFGSQLRWLAGKHLLLVGRDPMQYSARIILFLLTTNVMAILYIQSRSLVQEQALARLFLTNWLSARSRLRTRVVIGLRRVRLDRRHSLAFGLRRVRLSTAVTRSLASAVRFEGRALTECRASPRSQSPSRGCFASSPCTRAT